MSEPLVIGFDLANKTGICVRYPNGRYEVTNKNHGFLPDEQHGAKMARFNAWLHKEFGDLSPAPAVIAYERPHLRGWHASITAVGLASLVEMLAAGYGVGAQNYHTGTIKKFATGRGNAKKPEMIAEAQKWLERDDLTDDEADAYWVCRYAYREFMEGE